MGGDSFGGRRSNGSKCMPFGRTQGTFTEFPSGVASREDKSGVGGFQDNIVMNVEQQNGYIPSHKCLKSGKASLRRLGLSPSFFVPPPNPPPFFFF